MTPPSLTAAPILVDMLGRIMKHAASHPLRTNQSVTDAVEMLINSALEFAPLAPDLPEFLAPYTNTEYLQKVFECFNAWHSGFLGLLNRNWLLIKDMYPEDFIISGERKGGFNTFVRVPMIDHVDPYQFTVDVFREHGVQILPGPCFWSNQPAWQPGPYFWMRISFAMPTDKLDKGLNKVIKFARDYKG